MLDKKFFKIICFIALLLTSVISLSSCANNNQLLLLNWGEYINEDLVREFEEEYNCSVSISVAESNELFYSKIKSGTTAYDLVIPSDYMVEKCIIRDYFNQLIFPNSLTMMKTIYYQELKLSLNN